MRAFKEKWRSLTHPTVKVYGTPRGSMQNFMPTPRSSSHRREIDPDPDTHSDANPEVDPATIPTPFMEGNERPQEVGQQPVVAPPPVQGHERGGGIQAPVMIPQTPGIPQSHAPSPHHYQHPHPQPAAAPVHISPPFPVPQLPYNVRPWDLNVGIPKGFEQVPADQAQALGFQTGNETRYPIRPIAQPNYHGPVYGGYAQQQHHGNVAGIGTPHGGNATQWTYLVPVQNLQPWYGGGTPASTMTGSFNGFHSTPRNQQHSPSSQNGYSHSEDSQRQRKPEARVHFDDDSQSRSAGSTPASAQATPSSSSRGQSTPLTVREVPRQQINQIRAETDGYRSNAASVVSTPTQPSPIPMDHRYPANLGLHRQNGTRGTPKRNRHNTYQTPTGNQQSDSTSGSSTPSSSQASSSAAHPDPVVRGILKQDHDHRTPSKRMDNTIPQQDPSGLTVPPRNGTPKKPSSYQKKPALFAPPLVIRNPDESTEDTESPSGSMDLRARMPSDESMSQTPQMQSALRNQGGSPARSAKRPVVSMEVEDDIKARRGSDRRDSENPLGDWRQYTNSLRQTENSGHDREVPTPSSSHPTASATPRTPQTTSTPRASSSTPISTSHESPAHTSSSSLSSRSADRRHWDSSRSNAASNSGTPAGPRQLHVTPQATSSSPAFNASESSSRASSSGQTPRSATNNHPNSAQSNPQSGSATPSGPRRSQAPIKQSVDDDGDHGKRKSAANSSSQQNRNGTRVTEISKTQHQENSPWDETSTHLAPIDTPQLTSPPRIPEHDFVEPEHDQIILGSQRDISNSASSSNSRGRTTTRSDSPRYPKSFSSVMNGSGSQGHAPIPSDSGSSSSRTDSSSAQRETSQTLQNPSVQDRTPRQKDYKPTNPSPLSSHSSCQADNSVESEAETTEGEVDVVQPQPRNGALEPTNQELNAVASLSTRTTPRDNDNRQPVQSGEDARKEYSAAPRRHTLNEPPSHISPTNRIDRRYSQIPESNTPLTRTPVHSDNGRGVQDDVEAHADYPAAPSPTHYGGEPDFNFDTTVRDSNPTAYRRRSHNSKSRQSQEAQPGIDSDTSRPRVPPRSNRPTRADPGKICQETLAIAIRLAHTVRPIVEDAMQKLHLWSQCIAPLQNAFMVEGTLGFYECALASLGQLRRNLLEVERLLSPTARLPGVHAEWLDRYIEYMALIAEIMLKWVGHIPSDFALDYIEKMTKVMAAYVPSVSQLASQFEGLFNRLQAERLKELADIPIQRRFGVPAPQILRFDELDA